jgi:YfiH family protein
LFLVRKERAVYFQFAALNRFDALFHAVTCRDGGDSRPPYDGLNLSLCVGDAPGAVAANRSQLHRITGGGIHVYARQNHGTAVRIVTGEIEYAGETIQTVPDAADALITNVPGIRLLIQTADCQAIMLFDEARRVVANIHCGWRGNVTDIIGKTVRRMREHFGCDPGRMVAAIGPSLGPCCAEFINYKKELPPHLWPFRVGAHHFDLWRISRRQLIDAGVRGDHVHTSGICTRCNPALFYSYRAARRTGRFAALIGMDPTPVARDDGGRDRVHHSTGD